MASTLAHAHLTRNNFSNKFKVSSLSRATQVTLDEL